MALPHSITRLLNACALPAPPTVETISLATSKASPQSFAYFLTISRLRRIQILDLVLDLGLDHEFFVGYEKANIWQESDDEDAPDRMVGELDSFLLNTKFEGDSIFQSIISRFSVAQIMAADAISDALVQMPPLTKNPREKVTPEGEVIILANPFVVMTEDQLFVADQKLAARVRKTIATHEKEFQQLIATNPDVVDHETYVEWFLKWYPGLIKIRSLH